MVGGTQQQQLQQLHLPQSATTPTAATPAEEEFLKRNTDCVYFLASPLTCKKGSECEYRHSDIARVNPRDCWYWVNANCLNPKCAFRHPPLDGLLGAEVPTPMGSSVPQLQTPVTPAAAQAPYALGKQGVPCIFFQKGYCLKGDRCPFLHAPTLGGNNNKVAQSAAANPGAEPPTIRKAFVGFGKSIQEQNVPQINVPNSVELPPQGKSEPKVMQAAPVRNGVVINKNIQNLPSNICSDDLPRYRPSSVPPATNEILSSRSKRVNQARISDTDSTLNGKDADEISREPSPGFDVLVDDELGDSEYYHNEEQFGRSRGHDGRNLNDYDLGRSTDYNSMSDVDRDVYRDQHNYEPYERLQGQGQQYGWEEHRISSDRMLGERRYPRAEGPDQISESDLRHRIKPRRGGNGLRSVISCDHPCDSHAEDWNNNQILRRDTVHRVVQQQEGSLSSRLRGRIKIPGRSTSPVHENKEREMDMGRHPPRYSPGKPSNQGRLRDRIKGRVNEDFNNEGRDFRGPGIRRDVMNNMNDNNDIEFAGPKRLSEHKTGRSVESYEQKTNDRQSLGKRKDPTMESEDDLSFEGPKPLSEILKRKRGAETASGNNEDNNQKERKDSMIGSQVYTNKEETNSISGDTGGAEKQSGLIKSEKEKVKSTDGQSSLAHDVSEVENEEGMIDDEGMDDQETEAYDDHREGDFDYEQVDGEDYNLDEVENGELDDEYLEDDDGDDFAKKMGVVSS